MARHFQSLDEQYGDFKVDRKGCSVNRHLNVQLARPPETLRKAEYTPGRDQQTRLG